MKTTTLLTGASGFLGQHLLKLLLAEGTAVRCLVRSPSRFEKQLHEQGIATHQVQVAVGDLLDRSAITAFLTGGDTLIHCAAGMSGGPAVLFMNSVVPTRYLVQAASTHGIRRLVHISSLAVYDTGPLRKGEVLDESCPLEPQPQLRDPYTFSKVAQEEIIWDGFKEQGVVIRPGVIIGPGRGALSNRVGLKIGPLQTRFGSHRLLPYTYVENCARAIWLASNRPDVEGQAFNVVDDHLPTVREVLKAYHRERQSVRSIWLPQWSVMPLARLYESISRRSKGQLPPVLTHYRASAFWKPLRFSNDKVKKMLGWLPTISMAEALRQSIVK